MSRIDRTRAACLTPPAAGGVAVVQVIGADAPRIVGPHLASRRPLDLQQLPSDELRLCRFMNGAELIDDVLVCARRGPDGDWVIDLNLHGGPRIVQRVLMALHEDGAEIVRGTDLVSEAAIPGDAIEQECLDCLAVAQTRAVCEWLLRAKEGLGSALDRCCKLIADNDVAAARDLLTSATAYEHQVYFLLRGARIVVIGEPNAGKSTLVNQLAEREQILVSPVAGTTRDYVEQPAAIDGVPVMLVDTAGVRDTTDELERASIERTHQQIATADLILQVMDSSAQAESPLRIRQPATSAHILVWNKIDLQPPPDDPSFDLEPHGSICEISAATGQGLPRLRQAILESLGLADWSRHTITAFTSRQIRLIRAAALGLSMNNGVETAEAVVRLRECRTGCAESP